MTTLHRIIPQYVTDEEIRKLKEQLATAIDYQERQKLEQQVATLEDAIVIYRLSREAA